MYLFTDCAMINYRRCITSAFIYSTYHCPPNVRRKSSAQIVFSPVKFSELITESNESLEIRIVLRTLEYLNSHTHSYKN